MKKSLLLTAAALLSACSTVDVTTSADPSAPFAQYRTYTLAPPARGEVLSPASEIALRSTLRSEMAAQGIVEVAGGKADLDVVRHVFTTDKASVSQYTDWGYGYRGAWPYRYGYYGMWAGAPRTYIDVRTYTVGTLVLDFVDERTKRLVFRGVGKGTVGSVSANSESIREAVEEIVDRFPKR